MNRDFKGIWIPKELWLDENLTPLDLKILMEIDSLDTTDEGCYASNEYLSQFCKCSQTHVSKVINKLKKLNYIEITKYDGRKRYIKSRLVKKTRQTCQKDKI